MPGTLRGCEPVATMISFFAVSVCLSPSVTSTVPLPASRPDALDPVDLVLLEQELDAAGEALDDLVLAGLDLVHVDADGGLAERQAPFLPVLRDLQRVGVLEQRLGRDAAPVEAGAAEHRRALDDRGLQSELSGANRGDVAAGPGADHDDVVFVRH